ncbi:MAG TPA: class I SAM-dependent methyltransferase [Gemmatimonadaceae bacterium]|nr:class I SAM-dependent methyltransferase [Gemmatimonadaceae bacterium]
MMDDVAKFSEIGDRYGEQLARGLRLTGENAEYFARGRIARVAAFAQEHDFRVASVLDFGCGTGSSLAILREQFPSAEIVGFEPAPGLRALAHGAAMKIGAHVVDSDSLSLDRAVDLVYCNGVFHHIPLHDRHKATSAMARALRTDGLACVWENSPFNPGTRFVMSRVEFDRDAVLLTPGEVRQYHKANGLRPMATEYHFIFPRALRFARVFEHALRGLPLGGQFLVASGRD